MRRFGLRVVLRTVVDVVSDGARLGFLTLHSRAQLAAENLFLRKQLALYLERQVKPRRADDVTRITLVALSRFVDWRQLLVIVKPDTLIRWHRKAFRLFWRWRSQGPGRPRIPANLRRLIAQMATANRTWGEERIAAELLVKLGIQVSPRTVRRYMPSRGTRIRGPDRRRGAPLCGITHGPCWRAISSSRSPQHFAPCTCSWSSKSELDASSTGTRPNIRPRTGRRSSSA